MTSAPDSPFALYIHWPFCVSKCPYCDFNSHVRDAVDQDAWREALLRDMAHEAAQLQGRTLGSIFFGGGTPSLMPPATVAALIESARDHWPAVDDVEITLEANPSSVEAARFADLASAGVNRLSLGLQALDNEALRFLDRAHDLSEGLAALDVAQSQFARVSFDLIYARPDHDEAAWEAELTRALAFGTSHLSLYQLTIEAGTRFETLARTGAFTPLDADRSASLFEMTQEMTAAAGCPAYEVSNHARAGQESRHNLTYWRYGDYSGIGPGAHGRRTGMATQRHKKPENWMAALGRNGHGIQAEDMLSAEERAREALLMGLRLAEGVDLSDIAARTSVDITALVDDRQIATLAAEGLLTREGQHLTVTPAGMLLLDGILGAIVEV